MKIIQRLTLVSRSFRQLMVFALPVLDMPDAGSTTVVPPIRTLKSQSDAQFPRHTTESFTD